MRTMRKRVDHDDDDDSSSSVEPPRRTTAMRKRVDDDDDGDDSSSRSVEPLGQKTRDAADAAHPNVAGAHPNAADAAHAKVVALNLNLLSEANGLSAGCGGGGADSAADAAHAKVIALSLNFLSKASGLNKTGRESPPVVSSPDSSVAGQPVATAVTTPVISTSTSPSSGSEGLPDISGLAPGKGLDSNGNKKVWWDSFSGYARLGFWSLPRVVRSIRSITEAEMQNKKMPSGTGIWPRGSISIKSCATSQVKFVYIRSTWYSVFTNSTRCFGG